MPGPITPREAESLRIEAIPEEIYAAFNELIGKNYRNGTATVLQDEVVELALVKFREAGREIARDQIFDSGWLDIEKPYESTGWLVQYDRPSTGANFEFKKRRGK